MDMRKKTAMTLGVVATVLLTGAACGLLMAMNAKDELVAMTMVLGGVAGSYGISTIVMRFPETPDRR